MSKPSVRFRPESSFYAFTVRRPVAILMVVMAVVVFGIVSYQRLALTLMPDMSYPTLTVRTVYPGTAPEEIENIVSRPLEQALGIIPNLVALSSISKAGQSDVILEFQWKTDMTAVAQEVREKIDRIRFPEGSERPLLLHYDPSMDPIMRLGLTGPQSLYDLRYLAENDLKRRLETIPGVAAIKVKGGLEEEFLVALDESRLAALRLDITQIGQRLQQGNVNMPGGNLREGQTEYLIRTLNEFRTVDEIGDLIVSRQGNVDVRLRDIATVTRFHKDREIITRVNGRESIEIEIFKEADANVVAIAATLRETIFGTPAQQAYVAGLNAPGTSGGPEAATGKAPRQTRRMSAMEMVTHRQMTDFLAQQLPEGAALELLADQSVFISKSIDEVESNAVAGGVIAVVVIFLFLRSLSQTVIISLAIPVSIVATFAPMYMSGATLNIISLGGLALGVGMLVDNGIVVLESIFRCKEEGDDLVTAVVRGTEEVGMAVVASTLTTVAVFLPIVFVEGVAGQVFGDMALTVVFSLIASLFAALFLIPMLASRQFGSDPAGPRAPASDYLRFSDVPGTHAVVRAARLLATSAGRTALALTLIAAASLKAVAVLLLLVASPLLAAFGRRRSADASAPNLFHRLAGWASHDAFWRLEGRQVWPGLLSFSAANGLAAGAAGLWSWWAAGHLAGRAIRLVPVLVALAFIFIRSGLSVALRLAATVVQATGLMLIQALLAVARTLSALLAPGGTLFLDGFERSFRFLQDAYRPLLRTALAHRGTVLASAVLLLAGCIYFVLPRVGKELIPQVRQGEFNFELTLPIGTPLERTAEIAARIDAVVREQPEVERTSLTVGSEPGATTTREAGEHTAQLVVKMKTGLGAADEGVLVDRIRERFSDEPELELELSYPALFSFKNPIEVEIRGHDLEALKQTSRAAETAMAGVLGVVDVRSTLQTGHPEIQVVYNRDRLTEYGLNLRTVADLVRSKVQGRIATEFRREDQMIDIVVRLREEDRLGIEELRGLIINPNGAVPIPLSAIADLTVSEGPSEIRRVNQQRTALITANLRDTDLATASAGIVEALQAVEFLSGFSFNLAGQNSEMKTSLDSLLLAFALALFLVYIVMASQFESLVQPLLIMMTVPLALIGVILALWVLGVPISIMVFLGLIILAGIVVNNAIVLIDYINTLRDRGMDLTAAIIEAGRARLRPIFMTTLTTVLGLAPMALGFGEGAEIRAPMAITVIVGLTSSTLLTLVVIPLLYFQFGGRRRQVIPEDLSTPPTPPSPTVAQLEPVAR